MRKLPVILFAIAIPLVSLRAQDPEPKSKRGTPAPPPPKAKVVAQPAVVATPVPRRSVVDRLFGVKATPTPAPTPAVKEEVPAKPKIRPKRRSIPAAEKPAVESAKPAEEETAKPKASPAVKAEPTAKIEDSTVKPAAVIPTAEKSEESVKTAPVKSGKGAKKPAPAKPNLADLDDAAKYKAVKATALEDAEIKALKTKADTTIDEADAHRASVEYNKALFRKIRAIEPSLGDYVESVEQAMMKRLSAEKSTQ